MKQLFITYLIEVIPGIILFLKFYMALGILCFIASMMAQAEFDNKFENETNVEIKKLLHKKWIRAGSAVTTNGLCIAKVIFILVLIPSEKIIEMLKNI